MGKTIQKKEAKSKMEEEYLKRFLTPEEIDQVVRNKIELTKPANRKKGDGNSKIKWLNYEIECRRQVIIDLIRQGLSRTRISEELRVRWNVTKTTVHRYIEDAIDSLTETKEEYIEHNREVQIERLEGMLEECLAKGNYKDARGCMDMLNKIGGLYTENVNQNVAGEVEFKFGPEK